VRALAEAERIRSFLTALAAAARVDGRVYFTGGATAVLSGWRDSTIAVDVKLVPEGDMLLRAVRSLKDTLQLNVELASPSDFIPVPPGWEDRSPFVARLGRLSFHHRDLYAQALAKVERGDAQDVTDLRQMLKRGLIDRLQALAYFRQVESGLHRYPAIHPGAFRPAVEVTFA